MKDGVYEGEYFLLPVFVKVKVAVKSERIESIVVLAHFNGRGKAAERIVPAIVERQSLAVDTITGATHSSVTILKAVENALKKGKST